jgi:hypothetical protein
MATPQLRYSRDELLREHDFASPHIVAGQRIHGGFDASGRYVSPRTLLREPALKHWASALQARGGEPLPCSSSLLAGVRVPNTAQQKLLVQAGLGQTFWNTLTITGIIEARGRVLADIPIPSFQAVVVEDISDMAIGHLDRGLLEAHGLDEGGVVGSGVGAHDVMWFALRDLAFGPTDFPPPVLPESITRPDAAEPMPELLRPQARMLSFLMNLLMIELRAEIGFSSTEALLLDPELFVERRPQATEAARVVERIRQDERIHLDSLRVVLGEARQLTFRSVDGSTVPGRALVDAFWDQLVRWATVEQPKLMAERTRQQMHERIKVHPDATRLLSAFEALAAA